jgi:hypothetical protein
VRIIIRRIEISSSTMRINAIANSDYVFSTTDLDANAHRPKPELPHFFAVMSKSLPVAIRQMPLSGNSFKPLKRQANSPHAWGTTNFEFQGTLSLIENLYHTLLLRVSSRRDGRADGSKRPTWWRAVSAIS